MVFMALDTVAGLTVCNPWHWGKPMRRRDFVTLIGGMAVTGRSRRAQQPARTPVERVVGDGQRELRRACDECADRELAFEAREADAEAVVDAEAERDVAVVAAAEVEAIRIREDARIVVRGAQQQRYGEGHPARPPPAHRTHATT